MGNDVKNTEGPVEVSIADLVKRLHAARLGFEKTHGSLSKIEAKFQEDNKVIYPPFVTVNDVPSVRIATDIGKALGESQ